MESFRLTLIVILYKGNEFYQNSKFCYFVFASSFSTRLAFISSSMSR